MNILGERVRDNHKLLHTHQAEFQRIFGKSLGGFWHPIFGFEIIRFDDWVRPPNGVSLEGQVRLKWGQPAVDLIWKLIGKTQTLEEELEEVFS
jgi:hypothetical protein